MKTKTAITQKIKELNEEINDLNVRRQSNINKYGGISEDSNKAFFLDMSWREAQIDILKWVLIN